MSAQLVEKYPDDVQIIYRHFPLNSIHPLAQMAAEASEAAGVQGMFWEYHDELYENQSEWGSLDSAAGLAWFVDLAGDLGLNEAQFTADLENSVHADIVNASTEEAIGLRLPGTPSIIFNGQLLAGDSLPPLAFWIWDAFVQLEFLTERQYASAPDLVIDPQKSYLATVEMESGNNFQIELLPQFAPETVNNFIFLAREGWYDGVTFHRVLPGFVAQTGDPTGTGIGGPGYFIPNEIEASLSHDQPGIVAMANSGPDRNGSQWYITLGDVSQLDGGYTIFGRIVEGLDVVEAIAPRDPQTNPEAPAGDKIITIAIEEQ